MFLKSIYLQHFRSYSQAKFDFSDTVTVVIGRNTAGKTNLSESISLLLTGKSFRTSTDVHMIAFGEELARVGGIVEDDNKQLLTVISSETRDLLHGIHDPRFTIQENKEISQVVRNDNKTKLEVVIASAGVSGGRFNKKFFVNGVSKSRSTFSSFLPLVLFRPEELDIIISGPSLRREFLDSVLETVDKDYSRAKATYERSLRQRNALLEHARETGVRNTSQFEYWDSLLIDSGQLITKKRDELINFINSSRKDIFECTVVYDHSKISQERLLQYADAEIASGRTLVGPHRDDFWVGMQIDKEQQDVKHFGSRGQQRLVVLQLKMLQIQFVEEKLKQLPLLVLDDIFSELDSSHIQLVLDMVKGCQTIITTTHKEFIPDAKLDSFAMINL